MPATLPSKVEFLACHGPFFVLASFIWLLVLFLLLSFCIWSGFPSGIALIGVPNKVSFFQQLLPYVSRRVCIFWRSLLGY